MENQKETKSNHRSPYYNKRCKTKLIFWSHGNQSGKKLYNNHNQHCGDDSTKGAGGEQNDERAANNKANQCFYPYPNSSE